MSLTRGQEVEEEEEEYETGENTEKTFFVIVGGNNERNLRHLRIFGNVLQDFQRIRVQVVILPTILVSNFYPISCVCD